MLMTPVAKDSPLWAAWKAYQASEDYENTKIHAINPEHTEGSLWAAFSAGWAAGRDPAYRPRMEIVHRKPGDRHG